MLLVSNQAFRMPQTAPLMQPMNFDFGNSCIVVNEEQTAEETGIRDVRRVDATEPFRVISWPRSGQSDALLDRKHIATTILQQQSRAGVPSNEFWTVIGSKNGNGGDNNSSDNMYNKNNQLLCETQKRENADDGLDINSFRSTKEAWNNIDRLKVAALTYMLATAAREFVCAEKIDSNADAAVYYLPHNKFDLISAAGSRLAYERELAAFNTQTQALLSQTFKIVLQVLLRSFAPQNETRFDRAVLRFVTDVDEAYYAVKAAFDYSTRHTALARQYVYSALYDGQLLNFENAALDLQLCASLAAPQLHSLTSAPQLATGNNSNENNAANAQQDLLTHTLRDIEIRTEQIFAKHALFNQLLKQCTIGGEDSNESDVERCQKTMAAATQRLCELAHEHGSVWHFLRQPFVHMANENKSLHKATSLCCIALTNNTALQADALQQLDRCGFFDDQLLVGSVLDSGCIQYIGDARARAFLLEKVLQHYDSLGSLIGDNSANAMLLGTTTARKEMIVQRILWLLFLASGLLTRKAQKQLASDANQEFQENGLLLLQSIYNWLALESGLPLQAYHKTIHNFLLRHNQFRLALASQRQMSQYIQTT